MWLNYNVNCNVNYVVMHVNHNRNFIIIYHKKLHYNVDLNGNDVMM